MKRANSRKSKSQQARKQKKENKRNEKLRRTKQASSSMLSAIQSNLERYNSKEIYQWFSLDNVGRFNKILRKSLVSHLKSIDYEIETRGVKGPDGKFLFNSGLDNNNGVSNVA